MSRNHYSVAEYHSKQEKYACGYCKGPNTSYSHGMTTPILTVQHYQSLIDRGWRRSGCYCYKPIMNETCCPHYTIKCEALHFKISKSKKKIMKRMIKFLKNELSKDDIKTNRFSCDDDLVRNMEIPNYSKYNDRAEIDTSKMQVTSVSEEFTNRCNSSVSSTETNTTNSEQTNENVKNAISHTMEITSTESRSSNFDSSRGPQKKAKLLRIERKQKKLLAQGKTQEEINALMNKRKLQKSGKTLEDYFVEINNCSNKLELRLVRTSPISDSYKKSNKESFELYKKYQMKIHGDALTKLTEDRYTKFLVRSPLRDYTPDNGPSQGFGSFHEQYWLNGKLIAVAVIDILPFCVSSVYFFYDPTYSHLSLGTFSSIREVLLTRELNKFDSNLKYYYMGFYVHSCAKMRYKSKMRPSKLLCPETYVWCNIDECLPKIDISKYTRLNEDLTAVDYNGVVDLQEVLILYHNKAMPYGVYKRYVEGEEFDDEIKEYASLVGKHCALSMLYYID